MRQNALNQSDCEASSYLRTFMPRENISKTDALKKALEKSFIINREKSRKDYEDYFDYLEKCLEFSFLIEGNLNLNLISLVKGMHFNNLFFRVEIFERILLLFSQDLIKSVVKDALGVERYFSELPFNEVPLSHQDENDSKSLDLENTQKNFLLEKKIREIQSISSEKRRFKELTNLRSLLIKIPRVNENLSIQILHIINEFKWLWCVNILADRSLL